MIRLRLVEDPAALAAHVAAWEDLAANALEPNPFYEAWMLLPALEAFGRGVPLAFALAYDEGGAGPAELCGFFPLERVARYRGLPLSHVRLWRYKHCFLGTPLVRRGRAAACVQALAAWLGKDARGAAAIEWPGVAGDGPFFAALGETLDDSGAIAWRALRCERALLVPAADAQTYLARALPGPSRREFRRLARRLAEAHGALAYTALAGAADAPAWIERFLALEAAGWKGGNASALASSDAGRRFFTRTASEAARRGRLMMLALEAGGRTVAMKCNFLAGAGAFAFKIAYDEACARFSPGALLELENVRAAHRLGLAWMDSCAEPEHFMANRLWTERRTLVDLVAATGRAPGELIVSSLPFLHWMRRSLRPATPAA